MPETEGFVLTGKHAIMTVGWRKPVPVKLPEEALRTDEVKI